MWQSYSGDSSRKRIPAARLNQFPGSLSVTSMPQTAKPRNPIHKAATALRELRERHEDRHRTSGINIAFEDREEFHNHSAWDSVTKKGSMFLRRDVLRVIEGHGPENLAPRYSVIYRDKQPVAALAAQIVSVTAKHLRHHGSTSPKTASKNLLHTALKPAAHLATARLDERILVAGNLKSKGFHGVAFAPGENPALIWPGVADALYRIRRAERLEGQTNFVMGKDVTEQETGLEALRRFSYRPLETEPIMVLAIQPSWRNYEDYLAALDAKYRRNAKKQKKKHTTAGCTIEPLSQLSAHISRLHKLYLSVHTNASVCFVSL